MEETTKSVLECPEFVDYVKEHSISPQVFSSAPMASRHIRINPFNAAEEILQEFPLAQPIEWLESFYTIPSDVSVSTSKAYQNGQIYGIDASSGFAVDVLSPQRGEKVLDLCCAPGSKLAMIADRMDRTGEVVGVDISEKRLQACRNLLYKYKIVQHATESKDWRCRLYQHDGTAFKVDMNHPMIESCILDTRELKINDPVALTKRRKNKSARARERKRRLSSQVQEIRECELYDRVLVDAECTHDGSFKHLEKQQKRDEFHRYAKEYLNPERVAGLMAMQSKLLRNGFELLKPNGTLVYSTCSLSLKQNEQVIESFLKQTKSARIIPVHPPATVPAQTNTLGTLRFASKTDTSGLFIAKLTKDIGATVTG